MNRESRKLSRISRIPARLRAAGAESRPLKSERPAYDLRRTDPGRTDVGNIGSKNGEASYLVVISKFRRTH